MKLFKTVNHLLRPRTSNNHRAKVLHPDAMGVLAALMIFVFLGVSFLPYVYKPMGYVLGFASNITPFDVVVQTNAQRQAAGLPALNLNTQLSTAATAKAQDMMAKQYWAHTAPDGTQPWYFIKNTGYSYTVAGENLARDFSGTDEMIQAWMASPTHRANIMNDQYRDIGIAVVNGVLDGNETTLVVQMFGVPRSAAVTPTVNADNPVSVTAAVPQAQSLPAAQAQAQVVVSPIPESVVAKTPVPNATPTLMAGTVTAPEAQVLAGFLVPQGQLTTPPLFQPLQVLKAVFLAVIMIISFALLYDSFMVDNRQVIRLVGHNLGHILLFAVVAYLLLSFEAGILG